MDILGRSYILINSDSWIIVSQSSLWLVSILSNKCLMRDARQREMKIIRTKAGLENLQIQCTEKKLQNVCFDWAFYSQDLYSNSPYCLLYNSCDIGWENLVLDQLIIPRLIFVFILIFCLHDIVSIIIVRRNSVLVTRVS